MVPSFEGQLVPLAQHIVQLRRRPEFTVINQIADRLLQPVWSNKRRRCAEEEEVDCYKYICCCRTFYQVVKDLQEAEARIGRLSPAQRNFIALQSQKNALVEMGRKTEERPQQSPLCPVCRRLSPPTLPLLLFQLPGKPRYLGENLG